MGVRILTNELRGPKFQLEVIQSETWNFVASLLCKLNQGNITQFLKDFRACKICRENEDFQSLLTCRVEGINWASALQHSCNKLNAINIDQWTIMHFKISYFCPNFP